MTALPPYSSSAVAQLDRLERAGRGAAGRRRAAQRAVVKDDLDLKGRVAAGVQDLPGVDRFDGGHGRLLMGCKVVSLTEPSRAVLAQRTGHADADGPARRPVGDMSRIFVMIPSISSGFA